MCNMRLCLAVFSLILIQTTLACDSPKVKSKLYSTGETLMSLQTVFVIEFTLECKGSSQRPILYAELNNVIYPVARDTESNMYQVTFADKHKNLPAKAHQVRLFSEEGYAQLRKQQRAGENTVEIKSLANIELNHQGVYHGPWVHSETIAILISSIVCFFAVSARSKIMQ